MNLYFTYEYRDTLKSPSVEGVMGAGARENRGREREGGGRIGSEKRDLQEGGKREEK